MLYAGMNKEKDLLKSHQEATSQMPTFFAVVQCLLQAISLGGRHSLILSGNVQLFHVKCVMEIVRHKIGLKF